MRRENNDCSKASRTRPLQSDQIPLSVPLTGWDAMGFGVKLLCWMVHCVFQMVHDGTQGETSDALRIRYAPRSEILEFSRVSAFLCRCIPTPYPQTLSFPYPRKTAMRPILRFLQRADEIFHLGCRVLRHAIADVSVGVEREGDGCVPKG